jgi:L-threonylcarbamoyladenylate synthase
LYTKTQILGVDADQPDPQTIKQAASVLCAGGLVAFPTETVYGLGANALDATAVEKIYVAKGRPANNPLIVHIASVEQLSAVAVNIPDLAWRLAAIFWPGPLTLVLKRHRDVPDTVSMGRDTVAVRMPSHPVAQALIEAAGVPVVAPSANRFTRPSATSAQHVLTDLNTRIDLVLDGGPTPIGLESTVLDVTVTPPVVLRPGGVTIEALQHHIPEVQQFQHPVAMSDEAARPASPGMLVKHYSPEAEVLLFSGPYATVIDRMQATAQELAASGQRVGVLATDDEVGLFSNMETVTLGSTCDLNQVGQRLFSALRELDERGVDVILVRMLEPAGLGVTINDRLLRAAEGHVIEVSA